MSKNYLIKNVEIDCPICNKIHLLEKRKRLTQGIVKSEIVNYEEIYFLCPISDEEENEFVSAEILDQNLLRARDAYRTLKGLLTSANIAKIRKYYGLSQSDFSTMLGWGEVTITRYESKSIQDETYDNIMRMAYKNPMFALESIEKHKDKFLIDRYNKIRAYIADKVEEVGTTYMKKQEINSLYVKFQEESDLNGYKLLDIEKLGDVIGYFACFVNNLYKVKLMKLLWYADTLYYKRHGKAMTGLVYKHMPLGALPIAYDEIIHLPTVKVVEEVINYELSYKIIPKGEINRSSFSLNELSVLDEIATKFKDFNSREIINYMHEEKAYTDTEPNQLIPFTLSKKLNELA